MTKRPIVARVIAFCVMGGVAASTAISGAGPARASAGAGAGAAGSSSATKERCAGNVCETVTLAGDRVTVTTTAKANVHWCVKPAVTVRTPATGLTIKARPYCDQTAPKFHFVLQLRSLSFPVTVTSRWTHTSGAPSVTFRR